MHLLLICVIQLGFRGAAGMEAATFEIAPIAVGWYGVDASIDLTPVFGVGVTVERLHRTAHQDRWAEETSGHIFAKWRGQPRRAWQGWGSLGIGLRRGARDEEGVRLTGVQATRMEVGADRRIGDRQRFGVFFSWSLGRLTAHVPGPPDIHGVIEESSYSEITSTYTFGVRASVEF